MPGFSPLPPNFNSLLLRSWRLSVLVMSWRLLSFDRTDAKLRLSLADTCRLGRAPCNPRHLSTLSPNPPVDPRDCLLWDTLTRCFHFSSPRNHANFSVLFDCDCGGKGSPILLLPPGARPAARYPLGPSGARRNARVPDPSPPAKKAESLCAWRKVDLGVPAI
jgi:hypothetical protein